MENMSFDVFIHFLQIISNPCGIFIVFYEIIHCTMNIELQFDGHQVNEMSLQWHPILQLIANQNFNYFVQSDTAVNRKQEWTGAKWTCCLIDIRVGGVSFQCILYNHYTC